MLIEYLTSYDHRCGVTSSWCAMITVAQMGAPQGFSESETPVRKVRQWNDVRTRFANLDKENRDVFLLCFHEAPNKIPPQLRNQSFRVSIVGGDAAQADLVPLICRAREITPTQLQVVWERDKKLCKTWIASAKEELLRAVKTYKEIEERE